MATLNPYLTFNGNCATAMQFYKDIFGGTLDLQLAGNSPMASQMPEKYHQQVLHSSLVTANFEIMATDMVPGGFTEGNTVHMALICKQKEEMQVLFSKLAEGGTVHQPISEMFFGWIATLSDRFGKRWLLECNK